MRLAWPYIECYGYTWIQHPDGLYYGPLFTGVDAHLARLEERGRWGIARCGAGSLGISCACQRRTPPADRHPKGHEETAMTSASDRLHRHL
jgi:hypothetical protein